MSDKKSVRVKIEEPKGSTEDQPQVGSTIDDLDMDKAAAYLTMLDETNDDRSTTSDSPQTRLAILGLLRTITGGGETLHPTAAALLLFGKQPQKYMPQSSVKLARFRGTDVDGIIVDRKEVFGTLDKIIENTARFVSNNMRVLARIENLYREDVPEYPIVAVREAISNALAHRDYGITGQKVSLRMFDDRLEIESPGGLAGPVTLANLGQKRYSRNPLLARLMYELRLIEEMGTGIRRMRKTLAEIGSPPPSFITDESSFLATLPARPMPEIVAPTPPVATPPEPTRSPATVEHPTFEITELNRAEYFTLLQSNLNERQARGMLYAREKGRLINREYRLVNPEITDETARLDLLSLVDKGYLLRIGDKKGAYYLPR